MLKSANICFLISNYTLDFPPAQMLFPGERALVVFIYYEALRCRYSQC